MRRILFLTLALSFCVGASAQERVWTLAQCIDYALEHNIQIKQSSINVENKEISLNTSQSSRLPGLSASAGQNFSFGRGLTADNTYANTNTTSTSFSVGADVPVFRGFSIKHDIAMSRLDLEAATQDLAKAKEDISVAVAQAYVQILYSMEILEVASNQVSIDEFQVERMKVMVENGKASVAELSAQKATLAQSMMSRTQASNNLSLALLDMSQLLELDSPEGFAVVRPSESSMRISPLMSPEAIYDEAVEVKPAIKAETIRLDYALKGIDQAKSGLLPSLSVSGGVGSNYYTSSGFTSKPFSDQISSNFSQYLGLNMSVPIFSRFSTRNRIRTAKNSYMSQQLQLDNAKKNLYKEIQTAYYNAVASEEKYRSSESAAMSARDAFDLMQAKYENGKASVTEYNESKARYFSAESDLVQARYQHLYQSRLLDFYRGAKLTF